MGQMFEKNEKIRNHPWIIAVYPILRQLVPPKAKRRLI